MVACRLPASAATLQPHSSDWHSSSAALHLHHQWRLLHPPLVHQHPSECKPTGRWQLAGQSFTVYCRSSLHQHFPQLLAQVHHFLPPTNLVCLTSKNLRSWSIVDWALDMRHQAATHTVGERVQHTPQRRRSRLSLSRPLSLDLSLSRRSLLRDRRRSRSLSLLRERRLQQADTGVWDGWGWDWEGRQLGRWVESEAKQGNLAICSSGAMQARVGQAAPKCDAVPGLCRRPGRAAMAAPTCLSTCCAAVAVSVTGTATRRPSCN